MLKEYRFHTGEVELNYAKGPDCGPPLVWLHGLTGRWAKVIGIAPWLMLQHTLYAPDFRGHDLSGRVPGRYRCCDYGEDVRAFVEGVIGEPAILVGRSSERSMQPDLG